MPLKAVIDTNVWISALINPFGYPARLRKHFENGDFTTIISEPILDEIADVLSRPRIKDKYNITEDAIKELLILIEEKAEHVLLSNNINICRDEDDDLVIETAIRGNAKYIVTRDDDVKFDLEISAFLSKYNISVLTIAKFLKLLK